MKKITFLLLLLLTAFSGISFAQISGTVKGKIVDTVGKQNLAKASVSVLYSTNNGSAALVEADKDGQFLIRNIPQGDYRLSITFEGFEPVTKRFSITTDTSGNNIDFGTLYMDRRNDTLKTFVLERPPMSIKKDTVEYNAENYAVKPNAVAEDLLKKMPGVQVDKSGTVTAQGETVQRVMVNGKRFFSDDPKLATRNLPPDIIDKIQVFDDLSDQSKFTGIDDGNRVKTINIITKKNAQHGYFGKLVAGGGTDENYDESINFHRFDGNQQISLLGQANDINKQNFTIQDVLGNSGGRRGGGGGTAATNQLSPSVTTVWAGGANYRDSWGPNTDAYGSYFFNSQHVATYTQDTLLKQISSDSSNYGTGHNSNIQRTENHRVAFNIEHRFDSNNSLIFRPNISFQTTVPQSSSFSTLTDNNNSPVNTTTGNASSYNTGFNVNGSNIQLRHKFSKPFRTISLDLNGTVNQNNGYGNQFSINNFYKLNRVDTLNQYYNDSLHSYTLSPTLSYTEPVGKNQIIEFRYNYNYNHSNTINNTYDYSDLTKRYDLFDSLFSNSYKFTSHSSNFTLNYRIQDPNKFNLSFGSGIQFTEFVSINTTKDITVAHNYINFTPTVNFQYSFSNTTRFRLNYSGRTGTPSASQLQPLTTTSDSINFQSGNPNLKPQFTHSLRMLYASFDPASQHTIFATINASTIVNDIQTSNILTTKGGDSTTFVNLSGTYNLSGFFNYGIVLKKPKSNLNFITNINYSQSQSLVQSRDAKINEVITQHDYVRNTTLGETISWTTNIKKNFDMNFSYNPVYTISTNSIQSSVNENYFKQVFSSEFTAYTNSGWLIAAEFDYTFYNTYVPGYNTSSPILTPSIAKQLFKKKNGELRFSVFDLLNKNVYVSKSTSNTPPGFTINRTNTLSRYAMLTFTWNLNNFAGSNQRRMPGMFNNFRRMGDGGGKRGDF
ncbi:MAG TPA: outer membrane beta-barrel protein [Puia sp.]|nr:outer membrane beta-barrel protein [Puia sp.]